MKKQTSPSIKAHLLRSAFILLSLLVLCAIPFALGQRSSASQSRQFQKIGMPSAKRTLMFAERVAYQRAIEEVYWRHRIWPKHRPDSKPSLDAVMSQAELTKKVENYLRKSQALEDYWQRPISGKQLQAEMDRMAKHTKQPEVLRELFEALGNDAFVVAECLARPVLAEHFIADLSPLEEKSDDPSAQANRLRNVSMITTSRNVTYAVPKISEGVPPCTDDTWTATSATNAPSGRINHTAVWTGSEMIVWGGIGVEGELNTGGRYSPSTDSWTPTSLTNAPAGRYVYTVVWTGTEMIVWGGAGGPNYFNTGGRYNPTTDTWTATNTTNAPSARWAHTAVWTGNEMIVWGGHDFSGLSLTGGRYNPSVDSWTATGTTNAPTARQGHTAVWTGSEMIVWGGIGNNNTFFNTGGRYNPLTDSWTAVSTNNAPSGREFDGAVWTDSEMIIWGGYFYDGSAHYFNTGGRYDPSTDSWTATNIAGAPSARESHTAVWTGNEMIVWGGADNMSDLDTGGRYDPLTDNWIATTTTNAPAGRAQFAAVWAGSEMIVWGGYRNSMYLNTGGRYCAHFGPTPTPTPTATPRPSPTPRSSPAPRARPTPAPRP